MQYYRLLNYVKDYYKKIGYVRCPAFNYEKIFFNSKGFRHLLYKKGDRRNKKDRIKRLLLVKKAKYIISNTKKYSECRINGRAKFWSLVNQDNDEELVTVIVCQIDNGLKYFLSIMSN